MDAAVQVSVDGDEHAHGKMRQSSRSEGLITEQQVELLPRQLVDLRAPENAAPGGLVKRPDVVETASASAPVYDRHRGGRGEPHAGAVAHSWGDSGVAGSAQ